MNSVFEVTRQSFSVPFDSSDVTERIASATGSSKPANTNRCTNTTHHTTAITPHIDAQSTDAVSSESSVTEVVFTRHSCGDNLLLLPMVAHLSQIADRWVTWFISELPQPSLLLKYGVDVDKIRVVYNRNFVDQRELVGEALHNGASHTVIASFRALSRNDANQLERCAARGHSKALIVRYR